MADPQRDQSIQPPLTLTTWPVTYPASSLSRNVITAARLIACTTTMGLMGISKDTLIDGVDQLAGVTTYLAEAKQGNVNLFI